MSLNYSMHLGRRVKRDDSCRYGVVFGAVVVEVEQYFILCNYHEKPSEDAIQRIFDVSITHKKKSEPLDANDKKDVAYINIPQRTANQLETALRSLIEGKVTAEKYRSEVAEIEKRLKQ